MEKIFEDERSEGGMRDLVLAFKCLEKLYDNKIDKLTEKEMWALHNVACLVLENAYGEKIPKIGHLTKFGKRDVFKNYREEILKKSEHLITDIENY